MSREHPPPTLPFAVVLNDDPTQLYILSGLLRKAGLEPRAFTAAEDALADMITLAGTVGEETAVLPTIVVTDLYMPLIDGWRFCRLLRSPEYSAFNQVPILIISATYTGDEPDRIAADLGAEGFLSSPVDGQLFIEQVHAILSGNRVRNPIRVLIIEDNKTHCDIIRNAFTAQGYRADTASTALEGVDAFKKTDYDLAILDYHLPDGTGDLLLDAFRLQRPDCVCIMMTNDPGPELALDWMKRGATAYLHKPFEPGYLIELCARGRRERSLLRVQDLLELRTRELRESEERHRAILQTAMEGFLMLDMQGRLLEVNETYCRMSCFSAEELRALSISDLESVETLGSTTAHLQKIIIQGEDRFESRHRRKDGTIFDVEVSVQYRPAEGGQIVAFLRDITARKHAESEKARLEARLWQAQKMETVGLLAGGVAHDFNNKLHVILGYAEMALLKLDVAQPLFAYLSEIRKAAEHSADLTRQLLAFARKQTIAPKVLDLNETVAGILKMLQQLAGENLDLVWKPGSHLRPVKVDPAQIDQILADLSVNARNAISGAGRITIETGNSTLDEEYCAAHAGAFPGEYVRLAVSDTGCGMQPEILEHIFEPFFTTRAVGKGTGLGLATVYGIVKQNNGFIDVWSEPAQGTTVTIYFPRHPAEGEEQRHEAFTGSAHGDETILLVEEEADLLKMTSKMLEMRGYTVLAASTPAKAIRMAVVHSGRIDLLIIDTVLSEKNGVDLLGNLLSLNPHLRQLFISGYTANVIPHHGIICKDVNFIQKPFSMIALAAKVRETLDGK